MSTGHANIGNLRKNYELKALNERDCAPDPYKQFAEWFEEAVAFPVEEPNAMALATMGTDNIPNNRIVLLKGYSEAGFTFFTNYHSTKGSELLAHPYAAAVLFFKEMERQIRIRGKVQQISQEESAKYFSERPKLSQVAAWASEQSKVIANRDALEGRFTALSNMYQHSDVPKPQHWGGYCLIPSEFEFWQGRRSRLHDRIRYTAEDTLWKMERLSP